MDKHAPAPSSLASDIAEGLRRGALAGAAVVAVLLPPTAQRDWAGSPAPMAALPALAAPARLSLATATTRRWAEFNGEPSSPLAHQVADWVADSRDNQGMDFVIVDKKYTKVYVFDANARLRGATPVLLGAAPGDDTVPGIGSRPIAEVRPEERTTPAGRFIGERGRNALGEDVVWVDYDAAVSMHRVRVTNPKERRLERLATPGVEDNRISYGCINVPVAFYEAFVRPTFAQHRAVVYVLPEVKPVKEVFATSYEVAERPRTATAANEASAGRARPS